MAVGRKWGRGKSGRDEGGTGWGTKRATMRGNKRYGGEW